MEAEGVGGGDEDLQLIEDVDIGPVEGIEAFDDQKGAGFNARGSCLARVGCEVVDRDFDRVAQGQLAQVADELFAVEGLGSIEVKASFLLRRETGKVAVVGIERERGGGTGQLGEQGLSEGGLTGAGWAGDADEPGPAPQLWNQAAMASVSSALGTSSARSQPLRPMPMP